MNWQKKRRATADRLTNILQLDVRFYGRSFSWLTLGHMSGIVRGIATTFLMARWLDPVVLGQFRYVLALFGLAGIFSLTGMNASVTKGIAQGDTIVARTALRRILQFAPIGSAILTLLAMERYMHGETTVAIAVFISAVAFTPYTVSGLYGPILTGFEQIKKLSIMAVWNNLLYASVFVIVLSFDKGLLTITTAYFGFDILFRGYLTWREYSALNMKGSAEPHMKLGHHMTGMGVVQTLAMQINQILLQRFWGYSALASFSVATVIPEQLKNVANSLSGTFLQRLSRYEKSEKLLKATQRHFWIAFLGATGVVLVYILSAPMIIPWLFPQYTDAILPTIVYALGLLAIPSIVGLYYFQAHNEIGKLWRFYSLSTVLQLATSLLLVPFFGSWGAVWSRNITRLGSLPWAYPTFTKRKNDPNKPAS